MFYVFGRTQKILDELKQQIFLNQMKIECFQMKEGNFSSSEGVDTDPTNWQIYTTGSQWGGRDVHAWFRTIIQVPSEFDGKTIVIKLKTDLNGWDPSNPQLTLYVNGDLVQGIDVNHTGVMLDYSAVKGTNYRIDLHAYSGLTDNKNDLSMTVSALSEKVKDLYYDIRVPMQVAELLPEDDKNRIDISKILTETINLLDLRKPGSDLFHKSVDKALEFIGTEFYEKMCGHHDSIASCVGHTHIDVAYLWTLAQTREKTARSFSTVLKLMKEYPEYIFMSSQPQLYQFLKEDRPEVYAKVKERIKEGRWEAEGAMWVEADCNLSSGESLVRQILFGTRFFENEFGVKNELLWLPDVFGYSAALPQILKKSDIQYFMTTKISWNQFNKLPYDTFMWKGIDGTEILTHFITARDYQKEQTLHNTTYNGILNPSQIMGAWQRYQQKHINSDVLVSFGYGDGGGGPSIEMLENGRRLAKGIPGSPRVKMRTSKDYFRKLEKTVNGNRHLPKWVGELYLEFHRGTYTSMAKSKRYNRKSELLYQDLELMASISSILGGQYPQEQINQGWEKILLNQFHDIIPGSSIYEVYEDSFKQYEELIANGRNMLNASMQHLVKSIKLEEKSLVIFNTLSFSRNDVVLVELPAGIAALEIVDCDGTSVPYQLVNEAFEDKAKGEKDGTTNKALVYVEDIPAKGYKTYKIRETSNVIPSNKLNNSISIDLNGDRGIDNSKNNVSDNSSINGSINLFTISENFNATLTANKNCMENQFFKIELDNKGTITSLFDKKNNRQVLMDNERGNQILAFEDRPMKYENWDIDIYYQEKVWEVDEVQSMEVIEEGPIRACLRITKNFLDSTIVQDMIIYNDIPRIDFKTNIDWNESRILLKTAFPVDVHTDKASYEIQYGNVERPTHWNTSWDTARFEVCAHKWADLSEDNYGVSLLNDCKYGYDIRDGYMRLTLLKAGKYPNPKADQGEHEFTYSLYPHKGDWKLGKTVEMAHNLNVPLYGLVCDANNSGVLPDVASMVNINCDNVIVDTIKKAEDSDDIVIRMYECYNRRTRVELTFFRDLTDLVECNLMEKPLSKPLNENLNAPLNELLSNVSVQGDTFSYDIKPYEIKTFLVKFS